MTSEAIAEMLNTNPVVVRRTLGRLREEGFVDSAKGHGGGWILSRSLKEIALHDVYKAIGEPELFALGLSNDSPQCFVERAVNSTLSESLKRARQTILAQFKEIKVSQIAKSFKHDAGKRARKI